MMFLNHCQLTGISLKCLNNVGYYGDMACQQVSFGIIDPLRKITSYVLKQKKITK
eukprot:UN19032